jgi:hypothetical protein
MTDLQKEMAAGLRVDPAEDTGIEIEGIEGRTRTIAAEHGFENSK